MTARRTILQNGFLETQMLTSHRKPRASSCPPAITPHAVTHDKEVLIYPDMIHNETDDTDYDTDYDEDDPRYYHPICQYMIPMNVPFPGNRSSDDIPNEYAVTQYFVPMLIPYGLSNRYFCLSSIYADCAVRKNQVPNVEIKQWFCYC